MAYKSRMTSSTLTKLILFEETFVDIKKSVLLKLQNRKQRLCKFFNQLQQARSTTLSPPYQSTLTASQPPKEQSVI